MGDVLEYARERFLDRRQQIRHQAGDQSLSNLGWDHLSASPVVGLALKRVLPNRTRAPDAIHLRFRHGQAPGPVIVEGESSQAT